jgi:pimeloyl-ACP methyl ester carboxylesterase
MKPRRIHTLHRPAVGAKRYPPLLFVHGGYATAGCWDAYFLPWFSSRGFDCHALDLAGHGASEDRARLDSYGLDDYAEDVAQVAQELDAPAILIGHSMGTAVVERYLERHQAPAAVLMAPVPPTGILGATMKIALTDPAFFGEQARATRGEYTAETLESIRDVYYSAETTSEDLIRFGPLFQSESRRAILDLTLLAMHFGGDDRHCRSRRRRRKGRGLPAGRAGLHRRPLAGRGGGDSTRRTYADARRPLADRGVKNRRLDRTPTLVPRRLAVPRACPASWAA